MDRLEYIFMCQKDLQKELMNVSLPDDRPDLVSVHALGLVSEIGEVLQADKRWKSVNKSGGDMKYHNREQTISEIADCMNYFVNLCLALNIDDEILFDAFVKVQNNIRERNGLKGVRFPND